jgi:hypothetical protein
LLLKTGAVALLTKPVGSDALLKGIMAAKSGLAMRSNYAPACEKFT